MRLKKLYDCCGVWILDVVLKFYVGKEAFDTYEEAEEYTYKVHNYKIIPKIEVE